MSSLLLQKLSTLPSSRTAAAFVGDSVAILSLARAWLFTYFSLVQPTSTGRRGGRRHDRVEGTYLLEVFQKLFQLGAHTISDILYLLIYYVKHRLRGLTSAVLLLLLSPCTSPLFISTFPILNSISSTENLAGL